MGKPAKGLRLVLHIGLHKTATSYVQNTLSTLRYDLLEEGVLYPSTGVGDSMATTREGAQSGQPMLTRSARRWVAELLDEVPAHVSTVLVSSENFTLWHRDAGPAQQIAKFSMFHSIDVVLVLRRQDSWIESYYKQVVDSHRDFETRSFEQFLRAEGPRLLDFHRRFSPWRDLVGPENFHVLSYDDLPDASAITRRILQIAGVDGATLDRVGSLPVPRYDSIRAIDTLGLRILNTYRLADRDDRTAVAKSIYAAAPDADITLLTPDVRGGIQEMCAPVNERIEEEWIGEPVPGLRFAVPADRPPPTPPSPAQMTDYIDEVIALCEAVRPSVAVDVPPSVGGDSASGPTA